MKIEINSDHHLPLKKTLELYTMVAKEEFYGVKKTIKIWDVMLMLIIYLSQN